MDSTRFDAGIIRQTRSTESAVRENALISQDVSMEFGHVLYPPCPRELYMVLASRAECSVRPFYTLN